MRYDPRIPVAVFLGPSLERATAEALLPANYYPPVRMGDVYRLLGTGVKLIAIVDGVFHETTPVWQREILSALRNGIAVVGGSSMGALRAAELEPFGMIGRGRIFEQFRSGALDGDDEVALLHGDESVGYRALSLPLVNLRHDLERAVASGLVEDAVARGLVAEVKRLHFRERTLPVLRQSAALAGLEAGRRERLLRFIEDEGGDLKRRDAIETLRFGAALAAGIEPAPPPPELRDPPPSTFPAIEALRRGLLRSDGELVPAEEILGRLSEDEVRRRVPDLHVRFFLERFLEEAGAAAPPAVDAAFRDRWVASRAWSDSAAWLRSAGLTADELERALARRAGVEWMLAEAPEKLGVDLSRPRRCAAALSAWLAGRGGPAPASDELEREAAESAFLAAWAHSHGIGGPSNEEIDAFVTAWERRQGVGSRGELLRTLGLDEAEYREVFAQRACLHWLAARGPAHFGYSTWSLPLELLRELQLEGALAPLLERGAGA